jgi:hypothetical protein
VLTESTGIEVWEIFHSLKSSKLRPHFKTVFFNGSFATQANFDTLKKFIAVKVPLASCIRFVESLWVKQEMPQYGTNAAGEAMMVETADGFLTPQDPDCRFVGISGGVVFKGLNEWRFKTVNAHSVEKDRKPSAVGNTFKREDVDPCDWTFLPPQYFPPYLKSQGRLVDADSADSMVRPNQMNGVAYWKPIADAYAVANDGSSMTTPFVGGSTVGVSVGGNTVTKPVPDGTVTATTTNGDGSSTTTAALPDGSTQTVTGTGMHNTKSSLGKFSNGITPSARLPTTSQGLFSTQSPLPVGAHLHQNGSIAVVGNNITAVPFFAAGACCTSAAAGGASDVGLVSSGVSKSTCGQSGHGSASSHLASKRPDTQCSQNSEPPLWRVLFNYLVLLVLVIAQAALTAVSSACVRRKWFLWAVLMSVLVVTATATPSKNSAVASAPTQPAVEKPVLATAVFLPQVHTSSRIVVAAADSLRTPETAAPVRPLVPAPLVVDASQSVVPTNDKVWAGFWDSHLTRSQTPNHTHSRVDSSAQAAVQPKRRLSSDSSDNGCPVDFPFPSAQHSNVICYNTAALASADSGPCGSWCTQDVNIGTGCGSNTQRICTDALAPTASPTAALHCDTALWVDVDNLHCGGCTVLALLGNHGSCRKYCAAQQGGLDCVGSWEDADESCVKAGGNNGCDFEVTSSTDDIFECSVPATPNPTASPTAVPTAVPTEPTAAPTSTPSTNVGDTHTPTVSPTAAPTAAPTVSPTAAPTAVYTFPADGAELKIAVDLWFSNDVETRAQYGDISAWDTGQVTNMGGMFKRMPPLSMPTSVHGTRGR